VFNKQYSKADYQQLVAQIIEQMQANGERGEFLHPSLSPFGYNESVAQQFFPTTKEALLVQHGHKWSDFSSDPKVPDNAEFVYPAKLSNQEWKALMDDDRIAGKIFICEVSSRPFNVQKVEVEFYRKHRLPLPKKHSDIRHQERMQLRQSEIFCA